MTHRRKKYLVYKPLYELGDGVNTLKSKLQAKKAAKKLGFGAEIFVVIEIHKHRLTPCCTSVMRPVPDVYYMNHKIF